MFRTNFWQKKERKKERKNNNNNKKRSKSLGDLIILTESEKDAMIQGKVT